MVSCYTLAHTMELTDDMVELMLPNGSNSSPQDLVVCVEKTLPKHEEMGLDRYHLFTKTSMDKVFGVTKVKVRCIKVWWLSSLGLFLSLWPLPLSFDARFVAKNISGRPTNTSCNLVGIHRFTVVSVHDQQSYGFIPDPGPECHTIIIFRYEYKRLISINVFNPLDPKIFYFIYLATPRPNVFEWIQLMNGKQRINQWLN